jgi:hypothetical protein
VIASSAQALCDDERLMVIARESLKGWVAFHLVSERGRGRARRWQALP